MPFLLNFLFYFLNILQNTNHMFTLEEKVYLSLPYNTVTSKPIFKNKFHRIFKELLRFQALQWQVQRGCSQVCIYLLSKLRLSNLAYQVVILHYGTNLTFLIKTNREFIIYLFRAPEIQLGNICQTGITSNSRFSESLLGTVYTSV